MCNQKGAANKPRKLAKMNKNKKSSDRTQYMKEYMQEISRKQETEQERIMSTIIRVGWRQ